MPQPVLQSDKFDDTDQWCAAAAGWNLSFQQLERGPLVASMERIALPRLVVQRVTLSRRFHQCGSAPAGVLTFAIPGDHRRVNWQGKAAQPTEVMNFNDRNGFDAVSEQGFSACTFSMPSDCFLSGAEALEVPTSIEQLRSGVAGFTARPERLRQIRATTNILFTCLQSGNPAPAVTAQLQDDLACQLLRIIDVSTPGAVPDSRHLRRRSLARALSVIHDRAGMVSLSELCRLASTSLRTLSRAFREQFGVSPKQYLILARLAGAHRELANAGPETSVSSVACDWGFWHLGRFAADYKQMFGELPSETAHRGRTSLSA